MQMIKVSAGKLRAIGYDTATRTLRVELDDGSALEHGGVGESLWRNLKSASAQWSYYRDNIQDESPPGVYPSNLQVRARTRWMTCSNRG